MVLVFEVMAVVGAAGFTDKAVDASNMYPSSQPTSDVTVL